MNDSFSQNMDKILVHGGKTLSGTIRIGGSKNSALPILAATLLTREPCVIHHVPDLSAGLLRDHQTSSWRSGGEAGTGLWWRSDSHLNVR